MINVVIYDDHAERCESLEALLELEENIQCLGTFADCTSLESQMAELKPDIVLMDIRMPGKNGIEATTIIKKINPAIRIIIQTVYDDDEYIFNSLKAGAEGYILKSTNAQKIIQCIEDVYNGGAVITPSIAMRVARYFNQDKNQKSQFHDLTIREKEVLHLLTEGMSYKMVADKLNISYNTVNSHIKKIYEKLSVNSLGEAVSFALKNKLV